MGDLHIYDKAKYNMTGAPGGAPSWEHASATPLFMIRWCFDHGLINTGFEEEHSTAFSELKNGSMTLFQFYENECDLVFASDMLSDEGNAFVGDYFDYESGAFLTDLFAALGLSRKDYPLYTDPDYLRVKPLIDSRYAGWKVGNGEVTRASLRKSLPSWVKKSIGILIIVGMIAIACLLIWCLIKLLDLIPDR